MNLVDKLKLKLIFGLCLWFLIFNFSFAEENDLFLIVSPQTLTSNQEFQIEAKSFAFNASSAYFEWFENGKLIDSGTGISKKNFSGKKIGAQINIKVNASLEGKIYSSNFLYTINDAELIVRPLTYTPPFYRGSAFASPGSIVEVYAIPHIFFGGQKINSSNLIFEWKIDGNPVKEQSGKGKNKFTVELPENLMGENVVKVKINSQNGLQTYEKSIKVLTQKPEIIFYGKNPLLGRTVLASSAFETQSGKDFSIVAEPFFFDIRSIVRASISWIIDGIKINSGQETNPFLLDLTSQTGTKSENNVLFKMGDEKNIFQNGEGKIIINIKN